MEYIIRCSIEKFFASGQVENELDAIKKFINEYLIPKCQGMNQHEWRVKNTFNVHVDNFMKAYKKIWEHMYERFSGRHTLPGGKRFMMNDEFQGFVESSNMINDMLPARDISLIFNLSMQTQVDEVEKRRHLEASLLEFQEMLCRMCAQASFPPYLGLDENG